MFDPFWARVNEAGVTVVVHAGDSGVSSDGYAVDGFAATFSGGYAPSLKNFAIEKAVHDYLLSMVLGQPLQEVPQPAGGVGRERRRVPARPVPQAALGRPARCGAGSPDDPVEIFRRHVWINPFWEDDLASVVEWMGADRVLFGSDWPHIEALPQPLDYLAEAKVLDRRPAAWCCTTT